VIKLLTRCLFLICLLPVSIAVAQQDSARPTPPLPDTNRQDYVSKMRKLFNDEADRSVKKYQESQNAGSRRRIIDELRRTMERVKLFLRNGIDTVDLSRNLVQVRHSLEIVKEGVFVNVSTAQTQRNLDVSASILAKLNSLVERRKSSVDRYAHELIRLQDRLDSLNGDPILYSLPEDSTGIAKYLRSVTAEARAMWPIDSALGKTIVNIQELQNSINLLEFDLRTAREDVEKNRSDLASRAFRRDVPGIWSPEGPNRPLREILDFSLAKEKLALKFYLEDNIGRLILLALLIIASYFFLRSLRSRLAKEGKLNADFKDQLVVKYPLLSASVVVLSVFQFMFLEPTFIFSYFLWLCCVICLTGIFKDFISPYWYRFWLIMVFLFVIACLDNFVLQASKSERWYMLLVELAGVLYGTYILFKGRWEQIREKRIIYFVGFVVAVEAIALILNLSGRFNLSKSLMITGYMGLIVAILFLWTVRLINEGLTLASSVYKHPDAKFLYLNFHKVGDRAPGFFYVMLVIGWFILVGRNFYAYKQVAEPFFYFFSRERTLGSYTFSFSGILLFLLIMICALVISKLTSFFASDTTHGNSKKVNLGSWILLIRIFIISMGLFLAIAATGIPVDRITIVLGALGVGIGLGLQSLVSNLISGLIIAFEKPVNVGDNIEWDGRRAVMKSIGFRSSIITLTDGASMIVPNGDLLNHHLVNWSMGKNLMRVNLPVGVAYDTDLAKAIQILLGIVSSNDKVLMHPEPRVLAKAFGPSSIELDAEFWVKHLSNAGIVKNELIVAIHQAFSKEGIAIPIPQQDLYIRSLPDNHSGEGEKAIKPAQ